jgi:arsenate reductase
LKVDLKTLEDDDALKLLKENPKIMYRPILTDGRRITIGFKEENFNTYIKDN